MTVAHEPKEDVGRQAPALVFSDFLAGEARPILRLQWSHDGAVLAVRYRGGEVALWNVRQRRFIKTVQSGSAFSWASTDLAFARETRSGLAIGHVSGPEPRNVFSRPVVASAWSPDDARLAYAPVERPPRIFNRLQGHTFALDSAVAGARELLWVRNDVIVVRSASGVVRLATCSGPSISPELESRGAHSIATHPASEVIAIGRADGSVAIRSAAGDLVGELRGHGAPVCGLSFSSDAALLASKDRHGRTIVWRLNPAAAVAILEDEPATDEDGFFFLSPALAFSPVGHELAVGSLTAQLWTYQPELLQPISPEVRAVSPGAGRSERRAPLRDHYYDPDRRRLTATSANVTLKSATAYEVHFAGGVQVKDRLHESTLGLLVETLRACGATLATPHPIDLAMSAPISVLFEVKRVGPRHPMLAVREAVGQLMEYRYFLGPRDARPCIVLDEDPRDHDLVAYVEDELAMLLIWFADGKLCAGARTSALLAAAGLVR